MPQKVQGTEDLFGSYMDSWQLMQERAEQLFSTYGYSRIETPALEQLDTFVHGIGETTDVVRKEMFRVYSGALLEGIFEAGGEAHLKPRQRMALRPEGTAGVVRAAIEHNLIPQGGAPQKLWYAAPMFRGERPQKGRLRQFHQIGVEHLGASDAAADAEMIICLMQFFETLGLPADKLKLRINTMGDATCRPAYREQVKAFIYEHQSEMCEDCLERANLNPLRAFDCKVERCCEVMKAAPLARDYLCDECKDHYEKLRSYLDSAGLVYMEDPTLVRGLDYYTRTVFEVDVEGAEAVGAIGGGGRYDGLFELEGGHATPSLGFAVGFERIMLALETLGVTLEREKEPLVFVACTEQTLRKEVFELTQRLRSSGICCEADYQGRSLKSQFKLADKLGATLCLVLGPDELTQNKVSVRNLLTHEQELVSLAGITEYIGALLKH